MADVLMEVCCGSTDDVLQAKAGGADRVELNSDLFHGGLTPSIGSLEVAKAETGLPIMTMVRPREGGFHYTEMEFKTMLADAKELLAHGADGVVFGFLKEDGTVDAERCRAMLDVIGGRQAVFHRAVDVVPDWRAAIDILASLGVTRILTSGQADNVFDGAATVAEMIRYARGRIQILPGAGVSAGNVREIVEKTGCTQVHVAVHRLCYDRSTLGNARIFFGGAIYPPEDRYQMIDREAVGRIRAQADDR